MAFECIIFGHIWTDFKKNNKIIKKCQRCGIKKDGSNNQRQIE